MNKTIYTLNIDYAAEITGLTYPLMERFAKKMGADFVIISGRHWPEMPLMYEKLQIYYLAQERRDGWSLYLDSDALIHPDMPDPTELVGRDTVLFNRLDFAPNRFAYDNYFRRDGRNIGAAPWFVLSSDWCLDLWHPLDDMTLPEALARITPIVEESCGFSYELDRDGKAILESNGNPRTIRRKAVGPEHLLGDFVLSRNIARYGLKVKAWRQLRIDLGETGEYMDHVELLTLLQKVERIKKVLKYWMLDRTPL